MRSGLLFLGIFIAFAASAKGNPERDAYYGETHVHTSWSFDAFIFGSTETTPADAFKYAKGEPIEHPMRYPINKLGDKHYAARSNEFGYANYELIPVPGQLGTEVQFNLSK